MQQQPAIMSSIRFLPFIALFLLCIATAAAQNPDDWQHFAPAGADSALAYEGIVVADSAGGIWAGGHYQGIDHYDGTRWTHELGQEWIMALTVDRQGRVWAFSNGELRRRDSSGWKNIGTAGFNEVYYIAVSRNTGAVWTLLEPGLVPFNITQVAADMYNGAKWTSTRLPLTGGVSALAVDSADVVWIGTREKGLYRLKGTQITNITASDTTIPSNTITGIVAGIRGEIWIGTDQGLVRYRNGVWDRIGVGPAGLPLPVVGDIVVERSGGIWVYPGAHTDPSAPQIVRFDGLMKTTTITLPFQRMNAWGLAVDTAGHPWLSVHGLGMVRYRSAVVAAVAPVAAAMRGIEAMPNPFSESSDIVLDLPAGSRVAADIVDVRGADVRRLFEGNLQAGRHAIVWNGRDASGAQVASGVYYARVRMGGEIRVVPVVKAR
ncbi:MAG: two component regulator propeller domain protein [Chlorobi bacterium]|nr:two component regulator propeller domain protein [Chlorobiota bacterium]